MSNTFLPSVTAVVRSGRLPLRFLSSLWIECIAEVSLQYDPIRYVTLPDECLQCLPNTFCSSLDPNSALNGLQMFHCLLPCWRLTSYFGHQSPKGLPYCNGSEGQVGGCAVWLPEGNESRCAQERCRFRGHTPFQTPGGELVQGM